MALPMAITSRDRGAVIGADGSRQLCSIGLSGFPAPRGPPPCKLNEEFPVADSAIAPYRLPRTVVPDRYELTITPDLAEATFAGEARVTVRVVDAVTEVVLNAIELDIHEAELSRDDGAV